MTVYLGGEGEKVNLLLVVTNIPSFKKLVLMLKIMKSVRVMVYVGFNKCCLECMLFFVQVDHCLFTSEITYLIQFVPSVVILTRHGNDTALISSCSQKHKGRQTNNKFIINHTMGYVLCCNLKVLGNI